MIDYWTGFAATSNPNHVGQPSWARFHPGGSHVLALAPEPAGIGQVNLST